MRRWLENNWLFLVAIGFCLYSAILLSNVFHAQGLLKAGTDQRIIADSHRLAAVLADQIHDRRNATIALAESHEIADFLTNQALGMSLRYGLSSNLEAIEARFRRQLERDSLRTEALFNRITLLDPQGQVLVDLNPTAAPPPATPKKLPDQPVVHISQESHQIQTTAPVIHKGVFSGSLLTFANLGVLSQDLIVSGRDLAYRELLLSSDGQQLSPRDVTMPLSNKLLAALAKLPEDTLVSVESLGHELDDKGNFMALRSSIPDTGLSVVTLLSSQAVYGQITSRFFLYSASTVPLIILITVIMGKRLQRIREELAQSEKRFRSIFNHMRDAILIIDAQDGRIIEVNPCMLTLYGYAVDEVIGHKSTLIGASSEEYNESAWQARLATATPDAPQYFLWQARRKNGEYFWVDISVLRLPIDHHERLLVVAHDVTQRKTQEEALQRSLEYQCELNELLKAAQIQVLQSEKMASIGQLAAGVAHEINNPIGFVRSNLHMLKEYTGQFLKLLGAYARVDHSVTEPNQGLDEARELRKKLDIAFLEEDVHCLINDSNDGLERVIKIVKDLKEFSHIDRIETWAVDDIHRAIESTLNVIWNELKYKCEIRKEFGEIPPIECLVSQLNQVFMNLLLNAAQAIPDKGCITLRTGLDGDEIWIDIIDNGTGIPAANQSRIFDPFFTTKPVGKGTGLGLSITYGIIKKHHGSITVDSKEGEGTRFHIRLPVKQPQPGNT